MARPRSLGWFVALGTATAALALVAVGAPRRPASGRVIERDRVLVAAFENRTSDPALDRLGGLAADWIADGLLRSGVVKVVDPVTAFYAVRDVLADSTIPPQSTAQIRELAQAGAAGTVVWGEIQPASDSVVFQVRVSDAVSDQLVGTFRVSASTSQATTTGLNGLRQVVAGFLASRFDVSLVSLGAERVPPPRLDAYREFLRGLEFFQPQRYPEALAAFLASARLDPDFMLPIIWAHYAARNHGNMRVADSIDAVMSEILARPGGHLSPLDRYGFESFVAADQTGRDEAIIAAARLAPGSNWSYMQGLHEWRPRRAIASLELVDRQRGWARGWVHIYRVLAQAYHFAGDYERQLAVAREGIRALPNDLDLRMSEAIALAALGRLEDLDRSLDAVETLAGPSLETATVAAEAGRELRARGREKASGRMFQRADQWIEAHRNLGNASRYAEARGDVTYLGGRWQEARRWYEAATAARIGPLEVGVRTWFRRKAALAAGGEGRADEARRLMQAALDSLRDIPGLYSDFDWEKKAWLLFEARLAAVTGDGDRAAQLLREAIRFGGYARSGGAVWSFESDYMHDAVWTRIRTNRSYQAVLRGEW